MRRLSNSLCCICTVEPSRIDHARNRAPIRTRRDHKGFTLRCTSQVSHGAGGHQGLAWSPSQSRGRISPMVSMQHPLVMQRALPPCNKSADSPHTPAASPQSATETWLHCTGPEYTSTATCPSQQSLRSHHQPRPWHQRVGILDWSARSPLLQVRALAPCCTRKGRALLHAISGRARQSQPCALLRHCTPF